MSEMQDVFKNKLPIPLCNECMKLFLKSPRPTIESDAETNKCAICLGILQDSFVSDVVDRIRTSFASYGGFSENMLSKDAPTVTIPVHIVIRAQCALASIEAAKIEGIRIGPSTSSDMYTKIKDVLRNKVRINLQKFTMSSSHAMRDIDASTRAVLLREESGFMNCHTHVDAPIKTALPTEIVPIPKLYKKRERKRFRGNDPTDKQGGDPRLNLQNRVKEELNLKKTRNQTLFTVWRNSMRLEGKSSSVMIFVRYASPLIISLASLIAYFVFKIMQQGKIWMSGW
jgi:hypothetical protein